VKIAAQTFPKGTLFIYHNVYHPANSFKIAEKSFKYLCSRRPTVLSRWHLLMQYVYYLRGWGIEQSFNVSKHFELDAFNPVKASAVEFVHSLRNPKRVLDKQKVLNKYINISYVLDPIAFINKAGSIPPKVYSFLKSLYREGAEEISFVDEQTDIYLNKDMEWEERSKSLYLKKIFEKAAATIVAAYYVTYPLDKVRW